MKKLMMILGVLVLLLVVAFFVVTSSGFLKSVVLPRVGAALNAKVDAESIALSPFSSIEIRKLSVTPNGAETLATVDLARVRYRLTAILGGTMAVDEIHVGAPTVTLVQKADGTSNLDPILKKLAEGSSAAPPAAPAAPGKPVQLDLKSLTVENARVSYRAAGADGATTTAEITALNFAATGLKNGAKGAITVNSGLAVALKPGGAGAVENRVQGTVQGKFDMELTPDLMPGALTGTLGTTLQQAAGAFKDFQDFAATLTADLSPTELRRLALEFARRETALGSVSAKGPMDLSKMSADLQVDISAIDRNVLNLFGAGMGLDFGTTRFDSTNHVVLAAGGKAVSVTGDITGSRVSVKSGDMVMPALDLKKAYDVAVDLGTSTATLKRLSVNTTQGGREVLTGGLTQPMTIGWSGKTESFPDAKLELAVNDLRFQDWRALVGTPMQGGLNAKASLGVQGGGKDFGFAVSAAIRGLSGTFASNVVKNLGLQATAEGVVAAFAQAAQRRLTMSAAVSQLSGEAAAVKFDRYGLTAKMDLGLPEGGVIMNDIQVRLSEGTTDGGAAGLKGRWDLVKGGGELNVSARGINESALRPFLQAALGEKQLRSVQLSAEATTRIDPKGESTVRAMTSVTNLVVRDPSGAVPEAPLAVGLNLDASGTAQKLVIRQAGLKLTPTARAKNEAVLSGELDFSKTDAMKGGFKLTSESMDVTPYFDLFFGGTSASPAPTTPPPSSTSPPAGPQTEPDPIRLPVELLTVDAQIGRFFLREIAAENFVAGAKIQATRVEFQPVQLSLNGAPIKAGVKLNLGVPGYEYDVAFSADGVPVKPFANSFVPMLKDRIGGSIKAGAEVKGAGVTGVNLKRTLQGQAQMAVTNANFKLTAEGAQKSGFITMLTGLLATALNIRELKDQPIMDLLAVMKMGGGTIDVPEARVRSASLEAKLKGSIPIADDLMASPLQFPVDIALHRSLAERARLVSSETPTNAVYVPIPNIASMKGTLGAPEPNVDMVKAGLLAARGIAGLVGGQAGNAMGGVTDLVGGVVKGGTNAVGNLIQGIGGLLGGRGSGTNSAPAAGAPTKGATNAAPASGTKAEPDNPVGSLLKGLLKKP